MSIIRARVTSKVAERYTNVKLVLTTLSTGSLTGEEIRLLLGNMSASGTRKYIRELTNEGLISVVRDENCRRGAEHRAFRLSATVEQLEKLWTTMEVETPVYVHPSKKEVPVSPEGSFVHSMDDDEPFRLKVNKVVVKRDPLVSALFGPSKGVKESSGGLLHED